MIVRVVTVGKLKESFYKEACGMYLTRLAPYARIKIQEIADVSPNTRPSVEDALLCEAHDIEKFFDHDSFVVALAIDGKQFSSEDVAELLQLRQMNATKEICFIIGGSDGLHKSILQRADLKLSLGKITLPHNLARVVLLEQLYRAYKIIKGEPYHK